MKTFQINLLIVLALTLCGLCAFQWHEQTIQRNEIITLNSIVYDRNISIRDATNSIATLNQQLRQMDAHLAEVKAESVNKEQVVISQKAEITRLHFGERSLTNAIAEYTAAVDTLKEKLKQAYAGIKEQNASITNLIAQRDDLVKKYNAEVKDRNDIVTKFNDLAAKVQRSQGQEK